MVNNISKKKISEIPNVECEFKYGKSALTTKITEGGKDKEVVIFADLKDLRPTYNEEIGEVEFLDNDDNVYEFDDDELVANSDYEGSYHKGLSPLPSKRNSKYNSKGAIRIGFEDEMDGVDSVFEIVKAMASYGFNKSHSLAYSVLSYLEAYLSYYYPIEFYCAVLRNVSRGKNGDRGIATVNAKRRGIEIYPPDINLSYENYEVFTDEDGKSAGIVVGLGAIKGVGDTAAPIIIKDREENGEFASFDDFMKRMQDRKKKDTEKLEGNGIIKTHVKALIFAGAFDDFEKNRYKLMLYYYSKYASIGTGTAIKLPGGIKLYKSHIEKELFKGTKASKANKTREAVEETPPLLKQEDYNRLLGLEYEVRYLDQYTSEHPLSNIKDKYHINIDDYLDEDAIEFVGIVVKSGRKDGRNGKFQVLSVELASGMLVECKIWKVESVSKKKIPPKLMQVLRKESTERLEELSKLKSKIEAKVKKKGKILDEDLETYKSAFRAIAIDEYIATERHIRPVLIKGRVNVYGGEKGVIIDEMKEVDSELLKKSRKEKVKEKIVSTSCDIDEDDI